MDKKNELVVLTNPITKDGATERAWNDLVCLVQAISARLPSTGAGISNSSGFAPFGGTNQKADFDSQVLNPIAQNLTLSKVIDACTKCASGNDVDAWACYKATHDFQCSVIAICDAARTWAKMYGGNCNRDAQELWKALRLVTESIRREANDVLRRFPGLFDTDNKSDGVMGWLSKNAAWVGGLGLAGIAIFGGRYLFKKSRKAKA